MFVGGNIFQDKCRGVVFENILFHLVFEKVE